MENKDPKKENITPKTNEKPKEIEKIDKKEQKKQLKAKKKEEKLKKRQEKALKNVRWFWFFILFLSAIVILSMWDNHRKTKFMKQQKNTIDTLTNSLHFYKTKFLEKDSALTELLSKYNTLINENMQNSETIDQKKQELLRLKQELYVRDSILNTLKKSFDVALSSYSSEQLTIKQKNGKLYLTMRNKLLFPSGSAQVQPSGYKVLKIVADILKKNPNIDITIEGHTDNVPVSPKNKKFKDNWELSTARAVTVTEILVKKYNIRPERLTAAGRSMYYPVAPNTTEKGRAQNRRIEFIMTPNLEALYEILGNQTK